MIATPAPAKAQPTAAPPPTPARRQAPPPTVHTPAPGPRWDFGTLPVLPKLTIGAVDDPHQAEADRVADQVMRMPNFPPPISDAPPQISRKCAACEKNARTLRTNQTSSSNTADEQVPSIVYEVLRTPGQPLDANLRGFFERPFGQDFSQVRIHSDESASKSAKALNARAYTVRNDIVFGTREWAPGSDEGKRLLAHELTHVVQQSDSGQSTAAQREVDESSADTPTAAPDTSIRLFTVIQAVQSAYEAAQQELAQGEADPQVQEYVQTLGAALERMKTVAGGEDEALKQQVLAGFTAKQIEQAEDHTKQAASSVSIREESPTGPAMKSLEVSSPRDAAEVEADQVSDLVMSGVRVPSIIAQPHRLASGGIINRQLGPQLVTVGAGILVADAEVAPETGPPGWVVGGVIALAALAVIGVGMLMSSAGNVADTGIMEEARALIAAGKASDICQALAILMAGTSDSARKLKIKATQKAMGCRHSRWS
jgi:hypothetical protein